MNLEGKAGIVTGAGRGIGRSVALLMAKEGANLIVNDFGAGREGQTDKDDSADQVVAEIVKRGGKAIANRDSVSDWQAWRSQLGDPKWTSLSMPLMSASGPKGTSLSTLADVCF